MNTAIRTLVCASLATMAVIASADHHEGIERQYAKLKQAYWKENYKQAISVFGTNFTWIKPMGERVGYKAFAANLKSMFDLTDLQFHTVDMKNDSYSVTGDEAMVRSDKHISYSQRINGRMVRSHVHMQTVDTWRRGPGGWKLYKIQVLNQEESNDG
jgi:hypothetical protein